MTLKNTTPTPNELYDREMRKMSDTELRVVLVVIRATSGWEIDHITGMRKQEDWISQSQMIKKTGRSGRAISTALENCVVRGWIDAHDAKDNVLDTPQKRSGKKIIYRLGKVFFDKTRVGEKTSQVIQTNENSSDEKDSPANTSLYKRNPNTTKEIHITKHSVVYDGIEGASINKLIESFKNVNPSFYLLCPRKKEREAATRLIRHYGLEKIINTIMTLEESNKSKFAPVITSPSQLEEKLAQLSSYHHRSIIPSRYQAVTV